MKQPPFIGSARTSAHGRAGRPGDVRDTWTCLNANRGHAGGWRIATDLSNVNLYRLHKILGEPTLFAVGNRNDPPGCLVEQTVNASLDEAFGDGDQILLEHFSRTTLADLAADFNKRHKRRQATSKKRNKTADAR